MATLVELKNRKAVVKSCMEIDKVVDGEVSEENFIDYQIVLARLRAGNIKLLKPDDKCANCKWRH